VHHFGITAVPITKLFEWGEGAHDSGGRVAVLRTSHRTLNPAQGLERGRDGGEVKVMTFIRA
jgi:hypothetical protein